MQSLPDHAIHLPAGQPPAVNALPVLGAPLHWHPALLALTAIAAAPGVHLLASPLLEGRKVAWRDDYAAVLVGDPLLALAAGLGASIHSRAAPAAGPHPR